MTPMSYRKGVQCDIDVVWLDVGQDICVILNGCSVCGFPMQGLCHLVSLQGSCHVSLTHPPCKPHANSDRFAGIYLMQCVMT